MYTIIRHGKNAYEFRCPCGCQFICDNRDIRHEPRRISYDESVDIWHVTCPECNNHFEVKNLDRYKVNKLGKAGEAHGDWVMEERAVVCTHCGRMYDSDFEIKPRFVLMFKYCPDCGAIMDGGDEND